VADPVQRPQTPAPPAEKANIALPILIQEQVEESRRGFKDLMRIYDFRLIWTSQVFSQLADKFIVYSLLSATYQSSHANTQEAIVLLAYTFPSVLLSPIAGVYADRFDRRRLMMVTNALRSGLVLLVPASALIPYFGKVTWHLLLITFLFSAVGQFFAPAEASALPFIMPKKLLVTATSVFTLTVVGTLVVGLPISSLLIGLVGAYAPYYVAAVLFGGAAVANIAMRTQLKASPRVPDAETVGQHWVRRFWAELTETYAFLRARRQLLVAFGQLGLAVMLLFTIFTLSQGYMNKVLHLDPRNSYVILMPAALGMAVVAIYLGRGQQSARSGLLTVGLLVQGGLLFAMGIAPYLLVSLHATGLLLAYAAVAGLFFGGAFGIVFIPAITLLQEATDPDQRGRTFGAMFTVLNLAIAVPIFMAGLAADTFGLNLVLVLLGLLLTVVALATWPRKSPRGSGSAGAPN
jgi:MFS family permease